MKRTIAFLAGVLTFGAAMSAEQLSEIPIQDCNPPNVLMRVGMGALDRWVPALKKNTELWHQLKALTDKQPDSQGKPVDKILTHDDVEQFEQITNQIAVSNYYLLAESRLERDANVLADMYVASQNIRDGKPLPKNDSPEIKPYVYLVKLMASLKGMDHPSVKNAAVCSVNLAFQLEGQRATKALQDQLAASQDFATVMALRQKYRIPEGSSAEGVQMSPPDTATFKDAGGKLSKLVNNHEGYLHSLSDLMFLAEIVDYQYEAQKSDVLQLGPVRDVAEFDRLDRERNQSLSSELRKTLEIWHYIDRNTPSQQMKNFQAMKEIAKKESR
ncbi:hypothetical protein Q2T91_20345 [Ralstonia pseudosolanacearum]|uniref:hypothetical protein n=1 Tax=Ralstonia pseudosolanacearum TaxID=1310165 RepID=UPI00399AFBF9